MAKNYILKLALVAFAAGMALSCNTEIITDDPVVDGDTITLTCTIGPDPDSKVAVSDAGKVTWEPGDAILVHGEGSSNKVTVTLTADNISDNGKTATISVSGITPYDRSDKNITSTIYAAYPADAVTDGNLYYYASFKDSNRMLMAGYNVGNTLKFRNLCGLFTFTVNGDYDSYTFSGNNGETVGYGTYEAKLVEVSGQEHAEYSHYLDAPLTTVSGPVIGDGSTLNFIYIPMGASFNDGFTIQLLKGGEVVKVARTEVAASLARNQMIRLGSLDSHLGNPGAEEDEHNLSAKGTANCYVVATAGAYKFRTVRGNSSTSVGSVASAEVLWETWCNSETVTEGSVVTNVSYSDNYIKFSVPENYHPGNALIAAKDASGNILWSWHIWVPETMFTAEEYDFTAAPKMMSRNLGALIDTETGAPADPRSFGLLYQWGRKDPFLGANAVGATESVTYAGTGRTVSSTAVAADASASIPTTLISVDGTWCTVNDNMLWGDLERDSEAKKSVYDPCPVGYRMPARSKYSIFTSTGSTLNGFGYDAGNGVVKIGNPSAVFPICGYLNYNNSYVAGSAIVWDTRNDFESLTKSYCMFISGGDTKKTQHKRAVAGSARCVRETADPFTNAEGMPVMGSYTKADFSSTQMAELSGLCFSKDGDFMWGVGDGGTLYKINFDMTVSTHVDWSTSSQPDLEGVTMDPVTFDLYTSCEPNRIRKITAPGYTSITKIFEVADAAEMGNGGLEGITYYKDDIIYTGSQSGANLWAYNVKTGVVQWNKKLGNLAADIQEVGDLYYDPQTDLLWVSDSEAFKLFVFDGAVTKLKAMYDISFIGNPEAVLVDHSRNCVWVGDDRGSSSRIYKIAFSNL